MKKEKKGSTLFIFIKNVMINLLKKMFYILCRLLTNSRIHDSTFGKY